MLSSFWELHKPGCALRCSFSCLPQRGLASSPGHSVRCIAHFQAHTFRPKNDRRNLLGSRKPAEQDNREPAKQLGQRRPPEGRRRTAKREGRAHRQKYKDYLLSRIPDELFWHTTEGNRVGFYKHRLTDLGLLLPAEPKHEFHNSCLLEILFEGCTTVTALLWQYSDLGGAATGIDSLKFLTKVATLAKKAKMGIETLERIRGFSMLISDVRKHPGFHVEATRREKSQLLRDLAALPLCDGLYDKCLNNILQGGFDSLWSFNCMQQVATAIVYRENRFNQSLQSAGPPRDRHARKQRRQIQLAVDPEPCMLAIISEIGTRSLNEDNAATIVTMIVKIDRLGRGGVNEQAILKKLAALCLERLDLISASSIAILLAGLDLKGRLFPKFNAAASAQLLLRAKEFERSDLDKVMEVYEEFCKDRRGFKIANKVMPSIEAVNQGMEVILQLLGTENLEGFTISRLCRCLKGTLFRSDDFMALICDKASKRMVDLVTAASREDTQASKKSFAEFAKLSSDILHTCATLDYHPPQSFFNILDNCVMWSHTDFPQFYISQVLWSLAVLQESNLEMFPVLLQDYETEHSERDAINDLQVFQALKYATLDRETNPEVSWWGLRLSQKKLDHYREQWKTLTRKHNKSHLQFDVCNRLREMGIKLREETLVEEGTASVDIAFDFGSNSVAIEVDGPSHYTLNTFQQTGPTRMRDHVMRILGWRVINVAHYEYSLDMTHLSKYAYLREKLAEAGIVISRSDYDAALEIEQEKLREEHELRLREEARREIDMDTLYKPRPVWRGESGGPTDAGNRRERPRRR